MNEHGVKKVPHKSRRLIAVDSSNVNTVADTHSYAAYHTKNCWRALRMYRHRWPWTTLNSQNTGIWGFFSILDYGAHFKINFAKITEDNLNVKFSQLNVDFNSLSFDPIGSRSALHEST